MSSFTFNEYSEFTHTTAIFPKEKAVEYCTLGLTSEAGEVAGVVKRLFRGDHKELQKDRVVSEVGDVLWYCSELCTAVGSSMEEAAKLNVEKLSKRKRDGTIKGEGEVR